MASPTAESVRSPLDSVFHILPQGHDKPLKQAFYNTAATLFILVACSAAVAVYYILEAFLRPLLWAVLCGTFLHPFKNKLSSVIRGWLKGLRQSGTPLFVGTILIPVQVVDYTSESIGSFLVKHYKALLGLACGLVSVYFLYYFGLLLHIFNIVRGLFSLVYDILGIFSALWVYSLAVGYVLLVVFYWNDGSSTWLRRLAIPVWVALLFHASTVMGPLRVPAGIAVAVLMIVGYATSTKEVVPSPEVTTVPESQTTSSETESSGSTQPMSTITETPKSTKTDTQRPQELDIAGTTPRPVTESEPVEEKTLSHHCFVVLLWALVIVRLYVNFLWIIQLLPILLAYLLIKRLGLRSGLYNFLLGKASQFRDYMLQSSKGEALLPKPIKGLVTFAHKGDAKVVSTLETSTDKFVSILIILILLVGSVLMSFFVCIQVHKESMHLVSVSSNLLNNTLHPELARWLPDNEELQGTIDQVVGNAYMYGREWIADKIHSMLNADGDRRDHVQKQVLEVWDQLYENWFARNTSSSMTTKESSNLSSFSVWDIMQKAEDFNFDVVGFVQENIGTVMSVVESVWLVLKGNISLALSVLTSTVSLLLGGGTALLNFFISFMVFITALFYLLALSGEQYLPAEWFSKFSPGVQTGAAGGNKFGQAVEEAIGSVFAATLKMAAFYGLYTWFTHTLFGIQIVFIPSALAFVFAGIPFLGTYWAALPAVLELWLVAGQGIQAIILFGFHLLPMFVVDTAIYSEIKGGHPYLTGLAIAGGMYWMGLEGAIIGPIILCCMVVAMNVYGTMMKPDTGSASVGPSVLRHPRVQSVAAAERKSAFNVKRSFSADRP